MSMFPGPGASIIRNEAGEPLGWDYPGEYEPDYDERGMSAADCAAEEAYEQGQYDAENDEPLNPHMYPTNPQLQKTYEQGYNENKTEDDDQHS